MLFSQEQRAISFSLLGHRQHPVYYAAVTLRPNAQIQYTDTHYRLVCICERKHWQKWFVNKLTLILKCTFEEHFIPWMAMKRHNWCWYNGRMLSFEPNLVPIDNIPFHWQFMSHKITQSLTNIWFQWSLEAVCCQTNVEIPQILSKTFNICFTFNFLTIIMSVWFIK